MSQGKKEGKRERKKINLLIHRCAITLFSPVSVRTGISGVSFAEWDRLRANQNDCLVSHTLSTVRNYGLENFTTSTVLQSLKNGITRSDPLELEDSCFKSLFHDMCPFSCELITLPSLSSPTRCQATSHTRSRTAGSASGCAGSDERVRIL